MKEIFDHHHYNTIKHNITDRVSIYEKFVVDELLNTKVLDSDRESSIAFEIMHHRGCAQFARILSRKRNLPLDVCTVGALLHDIYVIKTGKYTNHAENGVQYAKEILKHLGGFSPEEEKQIINIIKNHSNKEVFSNDPFVEFGKDVDILDSFIYPNAFGYYLKHKSLTIFNSYLVRAKRIWQELNIPIDCSFSVLNNYKEENWLDLTLTFDLDNAKQFVSYLLHKTPVDAPTFLIMKKGKIKICINTQTFQEINTYYEKSGINILDPHKKQLSTLKKDSVESLFSTLNNTNSAVVVWGGLEMFEKHSTEDIRLLEFTNKNNI